MKGFNNLGNTCYLNSGLQMIIQNKDLCNIISALANKSTILNEYNKLIKSYYDGNNGAISPNAVKQLASGRNSIFLGFNQQDSSEFIIFFLDLLNSEVKKVLGNKSLVDKLYEIEIQTNTKCKAMTCLKISTNIEKSTMLMLNVDETCTTLDECYKLSLQRIKLDGSEKYHCENCNKKRIASQRKEVVSWPNHLVVWLRRYKQVGNRFSKYNQEIRVPIIWREGYQLTGIVFHSGSLHGGHYVYIGKVDDTWYLFNDSSVSEIDNRALGNFINNGYIYYFSKN